jgi:hypothetical protein
MAGAKRVESNWARREGRKMKMKRRTRKNTTTMTGEDTDDEEKHRGHTDRHRPLTVLSANV